MGYYTLTRDGIKIKDFNLRHTIESAQPLTFYSDYDFRRGVVSYVSGNHLIKIGFTGNGTGCRIRLESDDMGFAKRDSVKRFGLKEDMEKIYSNISTDRFMLSSIRKYRGMRVTLNDPWETTLCFIISQYNNVKRIRLIVKRFMDKFGSEILDENGNVIAKGFPTSEDLLGFSEKDFRNSGAGFRAKYIKRAADYCTNNLDLYTLRNKRYDELKEELMTISGVGDKVADCIALMGYNRFEAFPIDVWVKRTLERLYFKGKTKKIRELHRFAQERWGNYRGYAQQYLFHNAKTNNFK